MTDPEIKAKVLEAVAAYKARGGRIKRRQFPLYVLVDGKYDLSPWAGSCALGCLLDGVVAEDKVFTEQAERIATILGRPVSWVWTFIRGFDGDSISWSSFSDQELKSWSSFSDDDICISMRAAHKMGAEMATETLSTQVRDE